MSKNPVPVTSEEQLRNLIVEVVGEKPWLLVVSVNPLTKPPIDAFTLVRAIVKLAGFVLHPILRWETIELTPADAQVNIECSDVSAMREVVMDTMRQYSDDYSFLGSLQYRGLAIAYGRNV